MTLLIQNNATGAGAGSLDPNQAFVDLAVATNGDTGLGLDPAVGNRQQVSYARTDGGVPPIRVDALVNTAFNPDYGSGPQLVNIVILPVLANFVLNDGSSILNIGGTALPPMNTTLPGATLNTTNDCLVIYDTTQNNGGGYCTARGGSGGVLDLQTPNPIILYHELSHAFRIVNNSLLALSGTCDPSSPEENAAITDENDLRTQVATTMGSALLLRDPLNHCGTVCSGGATTCCIIASVSSGSPISTEVQMLRQLRDTVLRRTEAGFAFFQQLHRDYYAFSPQISGFIADHQPLRERVLEDFVRPLMHILRLMQDDALSEMDDRALGNAFIEMIENETVAQQLLDRLEEANQLWTGNFSAEDDQATAIAAAITNLLKNSAWTSEYITWGLIAPLQIMADGCSEYLAGIAPDSLGYNLHRAFSKWGAEMPIDHFWAALSAKQVDEELATLETLLLRDATARHRFRQRLLKRFHDITSIVRLAENGGTT